MAGERTEAPTPRRREEARKQGQVSKSQEVVSGGALLAAVLVLRQAGTNTWGHMMAIVHDGLARQTGDDPTTGAVMGLGRDAAMQLFQALLPLFAVVALAGVVLNVAQTGLYLNGAGLKPRMKAINPFSNAKRLVGMDGFVNLLKAVLKMAVTAAVVWQTMRGKLSEIATMGHDEVPVAAAHLASLAFDIALRAAAVLFVLALADWGWQRRKYLSNLRMTKEEVRQEMRETDGDPQVKNAIRRRRQALMNRMMAAVPKADVVVTNPTHYAVAIQYDPVGMQAPIVVAKGENLLAQRIKEIAKKAGVPVVEEPPLVRALYAAVPVGNPIPANLFHAVAEVLAWVYQLRQRAGRMQARPRPQGVS